MNGNGRVHAALKLAHHRHTARPLAHHHTSYRALFVVLAVMGLSMATIQFASADDYTVTLSVPTDTFSTAAMITNPANGSVVNSSMTSIQGVCEVVRSGTYVTLLRGDQALGTTVCRPDNTFSLAIGLILGENSITVSQISGSGGSSPASNATTITYTVPPVVIPPAQKPPIQSSTPPQTNQDFVLLPSESTLVTQSINNAFWISFAVRGGISPYTVETNWGDGTTESVQQAKSGLTIRLKHEYVIAGNYIITIRAIDAKGKQTTCQYAATVSGALTLASAGGISPTINYWQKFDSGSIVMHMVWASYMLLSLAVISLWFVSPTHTLLGNPVPAHVRLRLSKPRK